MFLAKFEIDLHSVETLLLQDGNAANMYDITS